MNDNENDQFVLTRNVNYPELIFNQRTEVNKYFEEDAAQHWRLAKINDCYICNRHTYTAICFEQGAEAKNPGLIEIKDEEFVAALPGYLNINLQDVQRIRPVIVGTVCNGGWNRKLMMLRAELFTTAMISESSAFMEAKKAAKKIKRGVVSFAEKNQNITEEQVLERVQGWNKVLHHKLNENYLTDVHVVNEFPNLEQVAPTGTAFIYTAFLKPGHHQFLIYCPATRRAFVKNIIVEVNMMEFYPEYPRRLETLKIKKPKQNVWRDWREDSEDLKNIICMNDFTSGTFNIGFIKDEEQR